MNESIMLTLAGIGLIASACQWLAWWVRLPAILFLLLAGIVAGPVTGWLKPDALFGDLLFPIISLSVAVILFEGSLTLRIHEIRGLEKVVRRLILRGMFLTWGIVIVATHYLLGFNWHLSALFGAIIVVTGPTVIVPMLRTVRPNRKIANILRWEGIVIDPLGALLAVLVFEFVISGHNQEAAGHMALAFAKILAIGIGVGIGSGYVLGHILRRNWLPEYLHNVFTLTLVFGAFAVSNQLQDESGLLTVTVMGLWLANTKAINTRDILHFKESLSVLLISGLFILLAARVDLWQFQQLGWAGVGVFAVIQLIARPAKVMMAAQGSTLTWQERALLSWIAPRGIVAAAVAALFSIRLQAEGMANADLLVPLTFLIIISTVVVQSATARPLAVWLGVDEPEPRGFLIVGANPVARAIAKHLHGLGVQVLVAGTNWDNLQLLRMERIPVYYGNPVSEHADRQLELIGIGRLLGLSPQPHLNSLAASHYAKEFGRHNIFSLPDRPRDDVQGKMAASGEVRGQTLFADDASYAKLASLLSQGAVMEDRAVEEETAGELTEQIKALFEHPAIPMFVLSSKGKLAVVAAGVPVSLANGDTVIALTYGDNGDTGKEKSATG